MICFVLLHFAIFSVSATHLLSSTMHQSSKTGKSSTIYPVFLCNETNSGFRFSTVFQKASLRSHIGPMANSHEFWILHKKKARKAAVGAAFLSKGNLVQSRGNLWCIGALILRGWDSKAGLSVKSLIFSLNHIGSSGTVDDLVLGERASQEGGRALLPLIKMREGALWCSNKDCLSWVKSCCQLGHKHQVYRLEY